jgi:hypothetical protein
MVVQPHPGIPLQNCRPLAGAGAVRWFRVQGDLQPEITRTTESPLRDLRTESGRDWSRKRLCRTRRKSIRHKPRE